jgi:hypothetical protein
VLQDDQLLEGLADMAPIQMMLGLKGGKGGFGALLRSTKAKAGQKKMDNNSACRDLNGRRLRHVQAEKQISEWKPAEVKHRDLQSKFSKIRKGTDRRRKDEFEVDTDESSQRFIVTFHYNKELLNKFKAAIPQEDRTFVKFSQQWLVTLKSASLLGTFITQMEWTFSEQARMWIWGASGPESISRNRQQFKLRNLKRGFTHIPTDGDAIESEMRDSVKSGLSALKRKQTAKRDDQEASKKLKITPEEDEEEPEDDAEVDPFAEYIQLKAPIGRKAVVTVLEPEPLKSPVSLASSMPTADDCSNESPVPTTAPITDITTTPPDTNTNIGSNKMPEPPLAPAVPKEWPPISLDHHRHGQELEVYGLEHLKHDLKRQGLKCGGSLSQRAERLFLLKTASFEELDKKHKA